MKKIFQINKITILSLLILFMSSCSNGDEISPIVNKPTGASQNIVQLVQASPDLSRLLEAITKAELGLTLSGTGTFTVFAPTNAAFDAAGLSSSVINAYSTPAEISSLRETLLNHVFSTTKKTTDLTIGYYKTQGKGSASTTNTLSMYINNTISSSGENQITINGGTTNKGGIITSGNIEAINGIIHKVNGVILPPKIINHANANPNFSTLVSTLSGAGQPTGANSFMSILSGTNIYTVFAPTNSAFTAATFITSSTTAAQVTKVLNYHITNAFGGNILSTSLSNSLGPIPMLTTPVQNTTINITGGAKIIDQAGNNCNIIGTDVQCANGVIHAIERVLLPSF